MDKWNVVFLLDKNPPDQILLLKRASGKKFAPGFYTGIGGKVEADETVPQSAYRELKEETGITGVELFEFARAIIDEKFSLHYFWGLLSTANPPESDDGQLEWTGTGTILTRKIIPTTLEVCKIWSANRFDATVQFSVFMKTTGEENGVKNVEVLNVTGSL